MPEFESMTVGTKGKISAAKMPILIKHLFEMTAGFSYNVNSMRIRECIADTEGKCPTRVAMKYLAKDPLLFEPGERWEYSLCHDVLAALVEVISGEKFEIYVKKHIFDVAGMARSTFMLPEEELHTLAEQYVYRNGKPVNIGKSIAPYKIGSEYASGGAGCISTVDDYIRFLEALRTYKLLKPETLALFTADRLTEEQKKTYWSAKNHGYGLGVRCPMGDERYVDFGWGGAAGAYLAVDMKNEITLYFGAHIIASPAQGLRNMLYRFVRAELLNPQELDGVYEDLERLHEYKLTY
jgi:CubicO group peptidase (beta-lactamase class C family)